MNELISELEHEYSYLQRLLAQMEKQLKALPDTGKKLSLSRVKNLVKYFVCDGYAKNGNPINRIYIPLSQIEVAKEIARREYCEREFNEISRRLRVLKMLIGIYKENKMIKIYSAMHPDRRALVEPIIVPDEEYVTKWQGEEYIRKGFSDGTPEFRSERGERVRSKSEIMIADKYFLSGVPYKYERPLLLKNGNYIHPDFTVLNRRLRKEYYHEHFGMVDDPQYAVNMVKRISEYRRNGIYIGEQLIVTFETSSTPLQKSDIENIISHYLS